MRCTILASGSRGNCAYIEGEEGSLLIDAGLSARETLQRLVAADCPAETIGGIIVTHEHTDHVRGLDVLSRRLETPVYATAGTLEDFLRHRRTSDKTLTTRICRYHERFAACGFAIEPFPTSHDAAEPCGFIIAQDGTRFGYCTDTGIITPHVLALLATCDAVVLESNHSPAMLANGPYPESLKRRIRSSRGHLSNTAASAALRVLDKDVSQIILAHLSEINNTPELARTSAREGLGLFFEEKILVVATQGGTTPECPQELHL
jgi:phosphoribosyl 1,2-cyclic phosphodiesterase